METEKEKHKINALVDPNIFQEFKANSVRMGMSMSQMIEDFMKVFNSSFLMAEPEDNPQMEIKVKIK